MSPLKILYISPENTVGTLSLWKMGHESRGNLCRYVTFYKNPHNFPEDICLELPLIAAKKPYMTFRRIIYRLFKGQNYDAINVEPSDPFWRPSFFEKIWFGIRDTIWSNKVEKAIELYQLDQFDIYHFEWGLDFYRDARFARKLHSMGKKIVCSYHGQDIRNRGVLAEMDKLSCLNLTSELDLLEIYSGLKYLFLPYDTKQDANHVMKEINGSVRVCHSPTNRRFKGSDFIIKTAEKVCREEKADFVLIENKPHNEVMEIKSTCHIFIDQIANLGGWGYGMNSVEAMSLGLCCLTNLNPAYEQFIPDHPFVNISYENFEITLKELINNPDKILAHGNKARDWVVKRHDIQAVIKQLYQYYEEAGIVN